MAEKYGAVYARQIALILSISFISISERFRSDARPLFMFYFAFFVFKMCKKCKKMQKMQKKVQKNLHISKICCNFAPNLKNNPIRNPKN